MGVAVLVVAVLALRNPKQISAQPGTDTRLVTPSTSVSVPPGSTAAPKPAKSRRATSTPASGKPAIGSQPLIVLNATTTPNLARDAASRFQGGGWNVTTYDENYRNDIISSCAYFDPAIKGAERAAKALQKQYPTIKRVAARFAELPAGPVVVVLTSDYIRA